MREMSAEMATLLKSKNMVGANAPSHEVLIIGNAEDELIDPTVWTELKTITTDGRGVGCIGETIDGRAIAIYGHGDAVKVGFASSIEALTSGSEVIDVANEITLTSGLAVPVASVSLIDGKLLAIIGDYRGMGYRPIYHFWRDDTGLGTSFSYVNTIWEPPGAWVLSGFGDSQITPPTKLCDGNVAVCMPRARNLGIGNGGGGVAVTTDYGNTWSNISEFDLGIGSHLTSSQSGTIAPISEGRFFLNHLASSSEQIYPEFTFANGVVSYTSANVLSSLAKGTYSYFATLCRVGDKIYRLSGTNNFILSSTEVLEPSILKDNNNYWDEVKVFATTTTTKTRRLLNLSEKMVYIEYTDENIKIMGTEKKDKTLSIKSISINRDKNIAGQLNLAIDNKDGVNSVDVSGVLLPNVEVVVKQGYGTEKVTTFTGLIDRVEMRTFPQEVLVTCRDKIKLALDQIITLVDGENVSRVVTYTDQTVEAIFTDLCTKAGLSTGTVEETGVALSEKTFSWETYGDAFQWLADLVGFEFTADEDGLVHFRADEAPTTPTVAYIFKEGEDIVNLGYVVDDNELYYDIYVYGAEVDGTVVYGYSPYYGRTNYNVLEQKILKIDAPDCDTYLKCQEIANRTAKLMASRARVVTFQAIGIPWLQIGDFIQVIESSTTISEIYRITGLQTNMDENGYTMTITCYYHSYGEVE